MSNFSYLHKILSGFVRKYELAVQKTYCRSFLILMTYVLYICMLLLLCMLLFFIYVCCYCYCRCIKSIIEYFVFLKENEVFLSLSQNQSFLYTLKLSHDVENQLV